MSHTIPPYEQEEELLKLEKDESTQDLVVNSKDKEE